MAFAMSTSGTSPNVLDALKVAREIGLRTVLLSGEQCPDAPFVDICLKVPTGDTARIQELHLLTWHLMCELLEKRERGFAEGESDSPGGENDIVTESGRG